MAVGGLPSKRQGRLGRPKDHRRPPAMDFTSSCRLSLFSSPSSLSTFFFSPFSLSFSFPRLLPLLLPRPLPRQLPLLVPSPSPPPPPPSPLLLLPRPLPLLLLLLPLLLHLLPKPPFPLLFTTSCETSHRLRLFGATPRDQARYPPTRIRPCHSGLPPQATSSAPSGLFQDQP